MEQLKQYKMYYLVPTLSLLAGLLLSCSPLQTENNKTPQAPLLRPTATLITLVTLHITGTCPGGYKIDENPQIGNSGIGWGKTLSDYLSDDNQAANRVRDLRDRYGCTISVTGPHFSH